MMEFLQILFKNATGKKCRKWHFQTFESSKYFWECSTVAGAVTTHKLLTISSCKIANYLSSKMKRERSDRITVSAIKNRIIVSAISI